MRASKARREINGRLRAKGLPALTTAAEMTTPAARTVFVALKRLCHAQGLAVGVEGQDGAERFTIWDGRTGAALLHFHPATAHWTHADHPKIWGKAATPGVAVAEAARLRRQHQPPEEQHHVTRFRKGG